MGINPAGLLLLEKNVTEIHPITVGVGERAAPMKPTLPSPRQIPFKFMLQTIPFDNTVEVTQSQLSLSKNHF